MAKIQRCFGISDGDAAARLKQARSNPRHHKALVFPIFPGQVSAMPDAHQFSLGVVILAAGFSTRMGRPKQLLPWGSSTILGHLVKTWTNLGSQQVTVVCQRLDVAIQSELDRVELPRKNRIFNPDPARGMFSSILCAAQWPTWDAALTHWALVLGDQPHLTQETLQRLIGAAHSQPDKICQPARNGHARHPVILPKSIFQNIASTRAATLKDFLAAHSSELNLIEMDDPGLDLDVDTHQEYLTALKQSLKT
jgi:molybdenum cofactor cytidylyltransferase